MGQMGVCIDGTYDEVIGGADGGGIERTKGGGKTDRCWRPRDTVDGTDGAGIP
jgi:hypothetical protein